MRLRELMKKNGYTQQSLADHIGVSRSTVGMWVTGRNEPDNGTIEKLAGLFGCSVGYLMGTEDEINAQRSLDALRADFQAHTEGKLDALLNQSNLPSNVRPISSLRRQRVPLIGGVAAGEPIYDPEDAGFRLNEATNCMRLSYRALGLDPIWHSMEFRGVTYSQAEIEDLIAAAKKTYIDANTGELHSENSIIYEAAAELMAQALR